MEHLGLKIQALRKRAGLTQGQIANYLHVDQSYVSKIEKGERDLTSDVIDQISILFGVQVYDLIHKNIDEIESIQFSFRASSITVEDLDAISMINRIALNSDFMIHMLGDEIKDE